jgi:hypothetical protein
VGTATLEQIFPAWGALLMAGAILISTFGCANGLTLAGARVYYTMSRDGLFFKAVGKLHPEYRTPVGGAGGAGGLGGGAVHLRVVWATAGLHCLCGAVVLHSDYRWSLCVAGEEAQMSRGRTRRLVIRFCRLSIL